jgi:ankyrin repeat protein
MYACRLASSEFLKRLILNNDNVNSRDLDGRTGLFQAGRKNKFEAVVILLGHGAEVDAQDNSLEIAKLLL